MMKINKDNFDEVISICLRAATEYQKVNFNASKGIIFDKGNHRIQMISPFFYIEILDVEIDLDIPKDKPFFNILFGEWGPVPLPRPIDDQVKEMIESCKFIGSTQYYASNIINIISKEMDPVMKQKARYVFNQGYLPEGTAAVTFKDENGKPVFKLGNSPKKFVIAGDSKIPEEFVVPGITYACKPTESGGVVELDVIKKFGKTSSGLYVSTKFYDSSCLPLLNEGSLIHPELTECSNVLDAIDEAITMPPVHVNALMLYDCLKTFLLCESTKFNMHFQEKLSTPIWLDGIKSKETDPKINIYIAPHNYHARIQIG